MKTPRTDPSPSRLQAWQRCNLLVNLTQQTFVPGPPQGVRGGIEFSGPSLLCPSTSTVRKPTKLASLEAFSNQGRTVAKALPLWPLVKRHKLSNRPKELLP